MSLDDGARPDPWSELRRFTSARVALGRAGHGLPTGEVLALALAHARAKDAVHAVLDADAIETGLRSLGLDTRRVASAAPDRAAYLARPDLGRRLSNPSREELAAAGTDPADLAIVLADGLSATAVQRHAVPLIAHLRPRLDASCRSLSAVTIAKGARVALGDEVAAGLGAKAVLVLIGERPGLSAPDSLGAYLTFAPRPGSRDADRNCVSNIRPNGLSYEAAAFRIAWLVDEALRGKVTGVALKDESDRLLVNSRAPASTLPTKAV